MINVTMRYSRRTSWCYHTIIDTNDDMICAFEWFRIDIYIYIYQVNCLYKMSYTVYSLTNRFDRTEFYLNIEMYDITSENHSIGKIMSLNVGIVH